MANRTQENELSKFAKYFDQLAEKIYGQKMGFMLIVGPLDNNENAVADYVGNITRDTGIQWLRETADKLEKNQDIAASKGEG